MHLQQDKMSKSKPPNMNAQNMPEGGLKMNKSGHLNCNFNYAFCQPKSQEERRSENTATGQESGGGEFLQLDCYST